MLAFLDKLEDELTQVEDLPTLPDIVLRIEQALSDDSSSANDVAKIMAEDPSLTSKVLRLANSVYYGPVSGPISSVSHAVARLGYREMRRLCTTLAVIRTFEGMGRQMDHRQFWKHSLTAAIAARLIRQLSDCVQEFGEDEVYVAGLLHDVGALVLDQFFPPLFREVRGTADENNMPYADAERNALGVDHGQIGGCLLKRWNLPETVVEAVTWHHQPAEADPDIKPLVQATHLADFICTCLGIGEMAAGATSNVCQGTWSDLKISVDYVPGIIEHVSKEARRTETFLALS